MKKTKRILCLLVTVAMIAAMSVSSYAASITIDNSKTGHTYEAYQIFKGTPNGKTLSDVEWGDGINEAKKSDLLSAYTASTAAELAEKLKSVDARDFAKKIAELDALDTSKAKVIPYVTDKYTLSGLATGYYLIKDKDESLSGHDAYTDYIVQVLGDTTMAPKSSIPSLDKEVNDGAWKDTGDFSVGDEIEYKLTATLPTDYAKYDKYKLVFTDTLSAGLTVPDSVEVKANGGTLDGSSAYTFGKSGQKLTITIADLKTAAPGLVAGNTVTVTYKAKLNDSAVIGGTGNSNKATLEYSNNPNGTSTGTTVEEEVKVYTYKVIVNKTDGTSPLNGAGFLLEKWDGSKYVTVKEIKDEGAGFSTFEWEGLGAGKYKLTETQTPAGFNTMKPKEFTITAGFTGLTLSSLDADGFTANLSEGSLSIDIANTKGSVLPETGGMGTTIFYVLGGILAVGAVVLLVAKKRMHN